MGKHYIRKRGSNPQRFDSEFDAVFATPPHLSTAPSLATSRGGVGTADTEIKDPPPLEGALGCKTFFLSRPVAEA